MKLKLVMFAALLGLAGTAFADTPPPPASTAMVPHQGHCEKDPAKCEAEAAKFDQWCQANQEKCTKLKSWAEKRIEFCEKNAQKCEEHKKAMEERHAQICQSDPSKPHCHAMRANHQPGDEPGSEGEQSSPDQMPPPPPAD